MALGLLLKILEKYMMEALMCLLQKKCPLFLKFLHLNIIVLQ